MVNKSSSSVMSQALKDLFQPHLIVSTKVFYIVFVHLVYNSAIFLASCCSFLLCHSQFDLYLLSFLSTGYTFYFSKISSFLLWSERVPPAVLLKNFILIDVNNFLSLLVRVQISEWGEPVHYILLFLMIYGPKFV